MTCKDCLYYEVCPLGLAIKGKTGTCLKFKNKADFVEVPCRCANCKNLVVYDNYCMYFGCKRDDDDFCSYGERK